MEPARLSLLRTASRRFDLLSNMADCPIVIDGVAWPTSEHYYQAMKFADPALRERIRAATSPYLAAAIGNDRRNPLRPGWDGERVQVMETAMRAKFTQDAAARAALLATGDERLVDHTAGDAFWGDGGDGRGANMLGAILMRLRSELRERA